MGVFAGESFVAQRYTPNASLYLSGISFPNVKNQPLKKFTDSPRSLFMFPAKRGEVNMKHRIAGICAIAFLASVVSSGAGCAPQQSESSSDDRPKQEASATPVQVDWSMESDCAQCHASESTSMTGFDCFAKAHADEGYVCVDCHVDEAALSDVHKDSASGNPATKLVKTEVGEDICLSCHGSFDEIADKTADVALVDDKGTAVNPHALPSSKDHDALACADCHVSHEEASALDEAQSLCASCRHSGVFECGTCHS